MASPFGHSLVALTVVRLGARKPVPRRLWILSVVSILVPDLDGITHIIFNIYSGPWSHRGATHSIFFAALWALILTWFCFRDHPRKIFVYAILFFATASHGILDAMTMGARPVLLFFPFDRTRYFLPFRIGVNSVSFYPLENLLDTLRNEFIWIALPCAAVWTVDWLARRLAR